jgi:hypothetical protein
MVPPCYRYPMNRASSASYRSDVRAFDWKAPAIASTESTLAGQFVMFNGKCRFLWNDAARWMQMIAMEYDAPSTLTLALISASVKTNKIAVINAF